MQHHNGFTPFPGDRGRSFVLLLVAFVFMVGCASVPDDATQEGPRGPGERSPDVRLLDDEAPVHGGQTADAGIADAGTADSPTRGSPAEDSPASDAPASSGAAHDASTRGAAVERQAVVPIDPEGVPLETVFPSLPGLRLEYATEPGGDGRNPRTVTMTLQPSRSSRNDVVIQMEGSSRYVVMTEADRLWKPEPHEAGAPLDTFTAVDESVSTDDLLSVLIAQIPWPRFLPEDEDEPFRAFLDSSHRDFVVERSGDDQWRVTHRFGDASRVDVTLSRFVIQPGDRAGGGPTTLRVGETTWELTSAAVYREREISGVVVSARGRPVPGIVVAPHASVGRLPASRVAVTDATGRFTLPFRAAPGDWVHLYFGQPTGEGPQAVIPDALEITGRIGSPDFTTLIWRPRS